MLYLAVKNGLGFHSEAQEIKAKHIELLKEYTGAEQSYCYQTIICRFPDCNAQCKAPISLRFYHLGTKK